MAIKNPLSAILALFGASCHHLEVTSKLVATASPEYAGSMVVVAFLAVVNIVLAIGYLVFGWHVLGWVGWLLKVLGTAMNWLHEKAGEILLKVLRVSTLTLLLRLRSFGRWLRT